MPKLITNSVENAQRYIREGCPPEARPYLRSLLDVISAQGDALRLLRLDLEAARAGKPAKRKR